MYHFMISYVNNHDRKIFNDNSIHRIAIIYSKRARENIENRAIDDSSVDGEHGDLIPYLVSKTSLSEEQIFNVISELIFAGVDTVCFFSIANF